LGTGEGGRTEECMVLIRWRHVLRSWYLIFEKWAWLVSCTRLIRIHSIHESVSRIIGGSLMLAIQRTVPVRRPRMQRGVVLQVSDCHLKGWIVYHLQLLQLWWSESFEVISSHAQCFSNQMRNSKGLDVSNGP